MNNIPVAAGSSNGEVSQEDQKAARDASGITRRLTETQRPDGFGMCSRCGSFFYQRKTYGKENIACTAFSHSMSAPVRPFTPSREDPIKECFQYYPAQQMGYWEMLEIATIIDTETKGPIGFCR